MSVNLFKALDTAVQDTLENMAFIQVDPCDNPLWYQTEPFSTVSIRILQPPLGKLELAVSRSLLQEITASIYGSQEVEITAEVKADTLFEVINTVAGQFLRILASDSELCQLDLPVAAWSDMFVRAGVESGQITCCYGRIGLYLTAMFYPQGLVSK